MTDLVGAGSDDVRFPSVSASETGGMTARRRRICASLAPATSCTGSSSTKMRSAPRFRRRIRCRLAKVGRILRPCRSATGPGIGKLWPMPAELSSPQPIRVRQRQRGGRHRELCAACCAGVSACVNGWQRGQPVRPHWSAGSGQRAMCPPTAAVRRIVVVHLQSSHPARFRADGDGAARRSKPSALAWMMRSSCGALVG